MTREEVFEAVRAALGSIGTEPEWHGARFPVRSFAGDGVERFRREVAAVAGECVGPVPDWREPLAAALADWGCVAVFAAPGMETPRGVPLETREGAAARPGAVLGVTRAAWGIAESGTVVLEGDGNQLPAVLTESSFILLDPARILAGLEDVPPLAAGARSRVLVTGPARTADIEKRIVLGAHGPRRVRIVLTPGRA